MTTYHDGIEVPQTQVDYFTGITLNAAGETTVTLTHVPASVGQIVIAITSIRMMRVAKPDSLAGKDLTILVKELAYSKPNSPTNTRDAAGGGAVAEPHTHTLQFTSTGINAVLVPTSLTSYDFAVSYQVV